MNILQAKQILIEQNEDPEKVDWKSYSPDIPLEDYLKNEYGIVLQTLKNQAQDSMGDLEVAQQAEFKQNKKTVEEYNSKKIESNTELEPYFSVIKRAINKMYLGFSNFVIIKGRAGLGKSYNIERYLKELKTEYVEVSHVSEAYLYRMLYENNGKIIWLKDFSTMLRSLKGIEELKTATETKEERLITNFNYSQFQEDLPKSFIFKGKLLIDCNDIIPKFKEDMDALISRAGNNYIDFSFDFETIKEVMFLITKEGWQKEVTEFLIRNYEFVGFNELNLRTQYHCFQTYKYCKASGTDWKSELKEELRNNRSRIRSIVYQVAGNKAIKSKDLKKYLIRAGYCSTLRTAHRRVDEWVEMEEIYKISTDERNFYVSLNPLEISAINDKVVGVN